MKVTRSISLVSILGQSSRLPGTACGCAEQALLEGYINSICATGREGGERNHR